jgi:hypothetical protein
MVGLPACLAQALPFGTMRAECGIILTAACNKEDQSMKAVVDFVYGAATGKRHTRMLFAPAFAVFSFSL